MKVLMVLPPNPILVVPTAQISLGPLYVAASLRDKNVKVNIADLRDGCASDILDYGRYDIYGFTATSPEYPNARDMAYLVKEKYEKATTVIGGPHATIMPEECVKDFDAVIAGEGEESIFKVIDGARGIINSNLINPIDDIPFPARDLVPMDGAFSKEIYPGYRYGEGPKGTSLITSRGCPYSCSFCSNVDRKIRYRSPENVVAEVKHIINRHKCRHFRMVDDNFTLNKQRLMKICEMLKPLKIHYRGHTRSMLMDEDMAEALKESGCEEMALGVEVADDYILEKLNKREKVEDHLKAIECIKKAGLRAKVYLMCATPFFNWDTVEKQKEFMMKAKPDRWSLWTFVPFPSCDIYRNPDKYGVRILEKDYTKWWICIDDPVIETDCATQEELKQQRKTLYEWLLKEPWKH
jgi:radical SAM superfamily enzyme YgiQ (UPF0313 family)